MLGRYSESFRFEGVILCAVVEMDVKVVFFEVRGGVKVGRIRSIL